MELEVSARTDWMTEAIPSALGYARAMLAGRPAADAEDLVQDSLCRLLGRAAHYDLACDGRKLLFRAVGNACINARTRRRELASLDGELAGGGGSLRLIDTLAGDPADQPEQRAMSAELAGRVEAAMARLPALQRAVMALRALGQSAGEAAEALEISPAHAAVLTHRARKKLAQLLGDVLEEKR